jgi:hypothetical protein
VFEMSSSKFKLFVSDNLIVVTSTKNPELVYRAGELTMFGLGTRQFFINKCAAWQQGTFKYDNNLDKYTFLDESQEMEFMGVQHFFSVRALTIMQADFDRKFGPAFLVELAESDQDFIEECYKAAVTQNPSFNPELAGNLKMAQKETRNKDGSTRSQEELSPLG